MAAPDCATILDKLHEAMIALATGERAATVSFGERSVTYTQQSLEGLERLYRTYYRQCGAGTGYPDLSVKAERGPPIRRRMI